MIIFLEILVVTVFFSTLAYTHKRSYTHLLTHICSHNHTCTHIHSQDSVVDSVVSDLTSAELNLLTQLVELFALLMQVRVKLLGLPRTL